MKTEHLKLLGIGSSFNAVEARTLENFNLENYIKKYQLFYTGRHAIRHLIDHLQETKTISKIWLPNYYCQHVTAWLKQVYQNSIETYSINPFEIKTSFNSYHFASSEDIVILNNFWGIYNYHLPQEKNKPIFIEDHSHGWLSDSCLHSNADYCFASLRKTLPVPLGGIIWSNKNSLPEKSKNFKEQRDFTIAWNEILKAMKLKTKKLHGDESILNQEYLQLIAEYEQFLHEQHQVVTVQQEHGNVLKTFLNKDYRSYKSVNLSYLIPQIKTNNFFQIISLKKDFSFGLHLVFKDRAVLNMLKSDLIRNKIYPSELWPDNAIEFELKFLLNIHLDFRYSKKDMDFIAITLNNWVLNQEKK